MPSDSTTPRLCRVCQTDISGLHPSALSCLSCRQEYQRNYCREYQRARPVETKRAIDRKSFRKLQKQREANRKPCIRCDGSMEGRGMQALRCEPCARQHKTDYDHNYRKGVPETTERKAYRNTWAKRKLANNPDFAKRQRSYHRELYAQKREAPGFLEADRGRYRRADPTTGPQLLANSRRYGRTEKGKTASLMGEQRRRAAELGQLGSVSLGIKSKLRESQGDKCIYCQKSLGRAKVHLDHIMPLALGGLHDDANLQVICSFCNGSKGAKHPIEFARSLGMLF